MAGSDTTHWRPQLERLATELGIGDSVVWTGEVAGDLKWGAFQGAEAFILPSHQENFGIAVAEALACGLPVLITDKVNIWREIATDRCGFVASDDLNGIEGLLRSWLETSPEARTAMGERARRTFAQRFEIRGTARSLLAILETVKASK
jgi:glycosyltransferase involved in cell wall biosynthesis